MPPWEWGFATYFSFNVLQQSSAKSMNFFWAASFQIRSETFGENFTKTKTRSGFLAKKYSNSKNKSAKLEFGWGRHRWFKINNLEAIFLMTIHGRRLSHHFSQFSMKNFRRIDIDMRSSWKITQVQKKISVESESGCGSYRWFKINYFFKKFVTAR